MADFRLSKEADRDLRIIYRHSFEAFGEAQAEIYVDSLVGRFSLLADNPRMGRRIDHIREGYCRFEVESHTIFYKEAEGGIIVMRILHKRMDTERNL